MVIKYFISGAILTVLLVFILLLYFIQYFTFSIEASDFQYLITKLNLIYENNEFVYSYLTIFDKLIYTIFLALFLFKLGAFPFHFYLNDIYSILHFRNSIFIYTVTLKLFIFIVLLKFINSF